MYEKEWRRAALNDGHGPPDHFPLRPFEACLCDSALPAADFEALLVLPSLSVFDAAVAARAEVVFLGALVCASALAAAVFDALPVDLLVNVFDAFDAALDPVTLLCAMLMPPSPEVESSRARNIPEGGAWRYSDVRWCDYAGRLKRYHHGNAWVTGGFDCP